MPYVRQRGNQVLIVHGEREPGTGKVQQRTLFTLYSQAEAREALGGGAWRFEHLLEREHSDLRFDWKRIRREIGRLLPGLPEGYDDYGARRARFRETLASFSREVMVTDPQFLPVAALLLKENRVELEYLESLLRFRLDTCNQTGVNEDRHDSFHWLSRLSGKALPPDVEEELSDIYRAGDLDRADKLFRLAVECFPAYAEGHNYLGLIALGRDRFDEAITSFERTVELGRKLFPPRTPRSRYWKELETRPYVRGLRNLAFALTHAERWDDALAACDRLEEECGDRESALATRGVVWMNTGRFAEAAEASEAIQGLDGETSFHAAFAQYESGRPRAALASFLHGALHAPRAARMLAGLKTKRPVAAEEARDHNIGVDVLRSLGRYLAGAGKSTRRFLALALAEPSFAALLKEKAELERRHDEEVRKRIPPPSEAFRLLSKRRTLAFARECAPAIADAMGLPPELPVAVSKSARARSRGPARVH